MTIKVEEPSGEDEDMFTIKFSGPSPQKKSFPVAFQIRARPSA